MENINEMELRKDLEVLDKEQIISLFLKLKKLFNSVCVELDKAEEELLKDVNLDVLIDSIKEEC